MRPADCSPSGLEAVLFPCCTSSCASQGLFGALRLLRESARTRCAGLVPQTPAPFHSMWLCTARTPPLVYSEKGAPSAFVVAGLGGRGVVHVRLAETAGQRRWWMSMQCRNPSPLQTTSQLCAHLSQSTSVTPVELPVLLSVTVRVERSTAEPALQARRLADTGSEREEEPVAHRRLFISLPASCKRRLCVKESFFSRKTILRPRRILLHLINLGVNVPKCLLVEQLMLMLMLMP